MYGASQHTRYSVSAKAHEGSGVPANIIGTRGQRIYPVFG
jgi:hypothetical protein